ncbi:MAG: hypothetical protein BA863_11180 [Desulfovibrio sp. S3730MH75]|nr:MAG: hypothetical protein BA863_11180 [Desulfovibrio sp. S3730MH75]
MDEKKLLDELIEKGLLGKGEAQFEVNVGMKEPKYIDLVFEKEDETWLIEAKNILNYKALGQVLSYKGLYLQKVVSSKSVRLGIVCEKSDPDIEQACKKQGIKIFVLGKVKEEPETSQQGAICGVCGESLKERDGELICEVCKHFFETTGRIDECIECHNKFAHLPAIIDDIVTGIRFSDGRVVLSIKNAKRWKWMCPKCRKKSRFLTSLIGGEEWSNKETTKEIIRAIIKSKSMTIKDLEDRGIPREFIEYCIGKRKIH